MRGRQIRLSGAVQGVGKLEGETQRVRNLLANNTSLLASLKEVAYPPQEAPPETPAGEGAGPVHPSAAWRASASGQRWRCARCLALTCPETGNC